MPRMTNEESNLNRERNETQKIKFCMFFDFRFYLPTSSYNRVWHGRPAKRSFFFLIYSCSESGTFYGMRRTPFIYIFFFKLKNPHNETSPSFLVYKAESPRKNARSQGTLFLSMRKGISRVKRAWGIIRHRARRPRHQEAKCTCIFVHTCTHARKVP